MAWINLPAIRKYSSSLAGIIMAASFLALLPLSSLRGPDTPIFLTFFLIASGGYVLAILRLKYEDISLKWIFGFAILFRVILLFSPPSLSDDLYRYIWDGHLLGSGVNPYAFPVNSPSLDSFSIPLRGLVNHNWMASPYLPVSQLIFSIVEFLIPQNVLAFQMTAVIFDLLTGWLVMDILGKLGLSRQNVLIYLWNPLVIVEFAHGAHVDAVMIFLMMLAIWFLLKESQQHSYYRFGSAISLAAATLTKFLPVLLLPMFWWRWRWKNRLLFAAILITSFALFIPGAGLGIVGPQDGTGVFGALRIYLQHWNFNSGIYHWLEVWLSGYPTTGGVPVEIVGQSPIYIAKAISAALLGLAIFIAAWLAWRNEKSDNQNLQAKNLAFIQLAMLPLGAYLLLTATVHPWYVTLIIPLLSFFSPSALKSSPCRSFFWPWVYFSMVVTLSYLTYLDPNNLREIYWVRIVEYIPFYGLILWASWRAMIERKKARPVPV